MHIDSIQNGIVIDHLKAGSAMRLYELLKLNSLSVPVAMIMNVDSNARGKKDILKIDGEIDINLDVVGYVDPGATVNYIRNKEIIDKKHPELPTTLTNVLKCKNPRCISMTEQELPQIFDLTDKDEKTYRCRYCEVKA